MPSQAKLPELLTVQQIGGKREWTLDDFLKEEAWDELGDQEGLRGFASRNTSQS